MKTFDESKHISYNKANIGHSHIDSNSFQREGSIERRQSIDIIRRLQQIKDSMRSSNIQNTDTENDREKLNKYLPSLHGNRSSATDRQSAETSSALNNYAAEDYEIYRKNLEQRLSSLFEKQKQVFTRKSSPSAENQFNLFQSYDEVKKPKFGISHLERQKQMQTQSDQADMERKIRILERKYLGRYMDNSNLNPASSSNRLQSGSNSRNKNRVKKLHSRAKAQSHYQLNSRNPNGQGTKPCQVKSVRFLEGNLESKIPVKQLVASQSVSGQDCRLKTSPGKTVAKNRNLNSPDNKKLKAQIKELKKNMDLVIEMNNKLAEKVDCQFNETTKRKERKVRTKALLVQIVTRLQEIKRVLSDQERLKIRETKNRNSQPLKCQNAHKQSQSPFQRQTLPVISKTGAIGDQFKTQLKSNFNYSESIPQVSNSGLEKNSYCEDIIKSLTKQLQLQKQHRVLMEKKCEHLISCRNRS